MIREVESLHKCKDCGKEAHSYQIGWKDHEGLTHWHCPRHYKQCKGCRKKTYKRIEEKKRLGRGQ